MVGLLTKTNAQLSGALTATRMEAERQEEVIATNAFGKRAREDRPPDVTRPATRTAPNCRDTQPAMVNHGSVPNGGYSNARNMDDSFDRVLASLLNR